MIFVMANQSVILISASMREPVCPQRCIGTILQLVGLRARRAKRILPVSISVKPRNIVRERLVKLPLSAGEPMSSIASLRNYLLQSLSAAELEELRPHLEPIELVREAVLVEAGAPLTHVYLPHSGVISLVVSLSTGETVEVAMVGRDSVFGAAAAFGGRISLTDAVVMLPGSASLLPVADFRAAADRSLAFRTQLVRHEQALFAQAQQAAACNASHPVEARLSRWLLRARDLSDSESCR
jgi:CRP-like cAMP-binding protein